MLDTNEAMSWLSGFSPSSPAVQGTQGRRNPLCTRWRRHIQVLVKKVQTTFFIADGTQQQVPVHPCSWLLHAGVYVLAKFCQQLPYPFSSSLAEGIPRNSLASPAPSQQSYCYSAPSNRNYISHCPQPDCSAMVCTAVVSAIGHAGTSPDPPGNAQPGKERCEDGGSGFEEFQQTEWSNLSRPSRSNTSILNLARSTARLVSSALKESGRQEGTSEQDKQLCCRGLLDNERAA